ncbi:phosphoribosylamine--glycine ligase [Magnetospira sp. QH-2]|uniref:phosphoribosylamine--glycine ligase n=1 Tax=Magnetospira sp. (strain QH-2) TaxID=1288970 RepID=UPI0003E80EF5|nr:phosphoribosylamine--glycine ligase [Magnetospira sp. QH-2]CCQ74886.1 Phosphoribosylamine--glycine ligase [Magnetospira sp. QH-2]
MKVLVVGSGGREHALCWAIAQSPKCEQLFCAPGNAGIAAVAECVDVASDDVAGVVSFAKKNKIDFVVIGPEAPLVAGLADKLEKAGITAFGPSAAAARIEGSKAFMKDLCAKYDIPTAKFESFDECDGAKEYIRAQGAPIVIKADGLAAGKGVILCRNLNEAFAGIDHILSERSFGEAGDSVVVEEFLTGEEVSFFALVDGKTALPLVSAQDHKAAYDGDEGPNTGGMGAYTPAPVMTPEIQEQVMRTIIQPTVDGMVAEGMPYKGVLFAGLMIEGGVPKLLEYNVRFGDPECQPMMMRLQSNALEMLLACAEERLSDLDLQWRDETAMVVVMAAKGYPGAYDKGSEIRGLDEAGADDAVTVFHAGTQADGDKVVAVGGRVLGVTAIGKDVAEAQKTAYAAVDKIDWPEGFCRRDIGWRALKRS